MAKFCISSSRSRYGELQVIIISLDITEDSLAQKNLNQRNNELKAIFDAIPDLYFRLNHSGIILDYKTASTSDMYVPNEVFLNQKIENFLPSHLSHKVSTCMNQVIQTRKLVTMEYVVPIGISQRFFEARFFPLFNEQIIVIIREITEKVEIQNKIIEKEKLLLETQKIANIYSFFWDIPEDKITYTDEFYNIAEIKEDEIDSKAVSILKVIHPKDRKMVLKEVQNSLLYKTDLYIEYRFQMPDKRIKYLLSEGKIKYDTKGNPIKMIGLTQDITIRKQNELELLTQKKELQSLLSNIEGIVAEQTNEIRIAKEKAENANQAKSFFLANVSHELKTPIHAIMSFAELGKERIRKNEFHKIQEYFEVILESVERLYNLMSNILDLSKLESGKELFQYTNSNLYTTCREVVQEMEAILTKKNLSIECPEPNFKTTFYFDTYKISQVIRNLIANSIRFSTPHSKIEIEFIQDKIEQEKNNFIPAIGFIVRDYGQGIQQDESKLIFEKFRQGKKVKLGTGGTGLGLSISKEIVEHHKGIIYADNHLKGGAVFTVLLPYKLNLNKTNMS
jgi:two-component system sensor kinase FixL